MNMSHDDFTLLAQMNDIVEKKYAASADELEKGNEILTQVFEKLQLFKPQFDQIDQIEQSLTTLEQLVKTLDDYSKLLELRFKKL
ncbi:putative biogenesis of lysosome-related organelles complex 1 subunit 2 [Blattamonas nauphoetae]|uniref:Biogenesis of lysosome-related organelles complex 1 subunit 2 n=1 Tax=Blattamonas nauphoetae TaxID=2049346 RepID=A0ABQ9YMI1_9EUKA|nr:putative biogenesis of lysosome-related organelles complex 1 subunit 2 [Blattamonas nauphoetae]